MLRHIPNILCLCRIALVLPLLQLLFRGDYAWAFAIFVIAGITDGLDGYLARRFNWRSQLGAVLDPIADKFLMVSVFLVLAATERVPALLALLVIGRDMVIVTGVLSYRVLVGPFQGDASLVSKFNTAMQLLFVSAVICSAAFHWPGQSIVVFLGAIVIVTTLVSGMDYVREGMKRYWRHRRGELKLD